MDKVKDNKYVEYIKNYIIKELNTPAYLWKDTPEGILIEAGLLQSHNQAREFRKLGDKNPFLNIGVDILQCNEDKSFTLIKCIDVCDKESIINDIDKFYMILCNHSNLRGLVYYTSDLSKTIMQEHIGEKINYVKQT